MKKHICILLIFTMIFTLFSSTSVSAVTSGSCGENTSYTLTDDGELIISGTGTVGRITQDNSIKQRTKKITIEPGVTGIFEQAFNEFSNADRIVIPDTITSIGMCAFEDTAYYKDKNNWTDEVLYIDKHLIKADTNIADGYEIKPDTICIADSAFQACTSLNRVVIPDSVTNIGKWAFCGSMVKDIIIPNSVTVIDRAAFLSCDKLESITIPDSVERIEYAAFVNCTNLKNITMGNGVTSVSEYVFDGTPYYEDENNWIDGVLYIGNCLIKAINKIIDDYHVKPGTICIADSAFIESSPLNIVIPGSVKNIGNRAFGAVGSSYGERRLTSVTIENGVVNIGNDAFASCKKLSSVTIPDSITGIGDSAFDGCSGLTSVTIPDSVTSIGSSVFRNCSSATSITIPNDVTSIGDNAFDGCSKLTDITIPDGVTNIGVAAFRNCSSATSITIPDSITYIGAYVFSGCSNLTNITIPDSVTIIGNYAFSGCSGLTSITIPDSVTNIDTYAFSKCSNLKTINLGSGITEIDSYAFDGCTNLTDIYYNNTFAKFQEIYIDNIGNKPFIQATKHYVSDPPPIVPDDPTEKGTVIAVKPVKGTAGNEITVPIYIKNNPGISGFSFKIDYDITQLVPLSITKNPDLPGSLTSNIEQPGNYTGLAYVTAVWSNASDYSENGELFYITFKVYGTIKKGAYIPIKISSTSDVVNQEYEEIYAILKNGSVIIDFIYGDIYGDGILDNKDLVRMRQYLADWDITLTDEEKQAADVYSDDDINNKDLVRLSQYFAGWLVKLGK